MEERDVDFALWRSVRASFHCLSNDYRGSISHDIVGNVVLFSGSASPGEVPLINIHPTSGWRGPFHMSIPTAQPGQQWKSARSAKILAEDRQRSGPSCMTADIPAEPQRYLSRSSRGWTTLPVFRSFKPLARGAWSFAFAFPFLFNIVHSRMKAISHVKINV